jgi:hypothetical protein
MDGWGAGINESDRDRTGATDAQVGLEAKIIMYARFEQIDFAGLYMLQNSAMTLVESDAHSDPTEIPPWC